MQIRRFSGAWVAVAAATGLLAPAGTALAQGKPPVLEHDSLFVGQSPVYEPIPPGATVDPNSAAYIARMAQVAGSGNFLMPINNFSHPVYYADASTPRHAVELTVFGTYPGAGYCGKWRLLNVPIPSFAEADPASDGAMIVIDRSNGCVYDFWGFGQPWSYAVSPKSLWASALSADGDGVYDYNETGAGNAANFSGPNGLVWPDEIAAGYVPHALVFGYDGNFVRGGGPVPPATHSDGQSSHPDALPEGARVRLRADVNIASLGLPPHVEAIAYALQEYGMFLADVSGSGVRIKAVSGLSADPNPWIGVVPNPSDPTVSLAGIPVDQFEVLTLPEPVSGSSVCPSPTPCGTYTTPPPCQGCFCTASTVSFLESGAPLALLGPTFFVAFAWARRRRRTNSGA